MSLSFMAPVAGDEPPLQSRRHCCALCSVPANVSVEAPPQGPHEAPRHQHFKNRGPVVSSGVLESKVWAETGNFCLLP